MTSDNISKPNLLVLGTQVTHKMCQNVKVKVRALLPYEPCCFCFCSRCSKGSKAHAYSLSHYLSLFVPFCSPLHTQATTNAALQKLDGLLQCLVDVNGQ